MIANRKLQALVDGILAPTTHCQIDYAICLEKLSANGQLFVDDQTAVGLYQTTQIK